MRQLSSNNSRQRLQNRWRMDTFQPRIRKSSRTISSKRTSSLHRFTKMAM